MVTKCKTRVYITRKAIYQPSCVWSIKHCQGFLPQNCSTTRTPQRIGKSRSNGSFRFCLQRRDRVVLDIDQGYQNSNVGFKSSLPISIYDPSCFITSCFITLTSPKPTPSSLLLQLIQVRLLWHLYINIYECAI